MKPKPCPYCKKPVDICIIEGMVVMYDHETHDPHECSNKLMMASGDRCPICGEKDDMSRHLCKR